MKRDFKAEELAVIESLYAPLSGDGTPVDALRKISAYMDTDRAVLRFINIETGITHSNFATSASNSAYERERQNADDVIKEEADLANRLKDRWTRDGYWLVQYGLPSFSRTKARDLLARHGIGNAMGGDIFRYSTYAGRLVIHRYGKRQLHTAEDINRLKRLVPHIRSSFQATVRLQESLNQLEATRCGLDKIFLGMALITATLDVTYMNRRAEELLNGGTGLYLDGRKLRARNLDEDARLQKLLKEASLTARGIVSAPGRSMSLSIQGQRADESALSLKGKCRRLHLTVIPIVSSPAASGLIPSVTDSETQRSYGLVFFQEDRRELPACSAEILQQLYNLTHTEASLAIALAGGRTPEEYAGFFGISPHTAKQHLKSIFRKMGVGRQTDLVRLVLSGPAGWVS